MTAEEELETAPEPKFSIALVADRINEERPALADCGAPLGLGGGREATAAPELAAPVENCSANRFGVGGCGAA